MFSGLKQLIQYREFFRQTILQQLKARYRSSALGFLWTLLNPLLALLVLSFVFSYVNHWNLKVFGVYFFSGYVPWLFFVSATNGAANAVVGNGLYVTRISVPRLVFPLSVVAVSAVDFGVGLVILFALALLVNAPLTAACLILPLGVILLALFITGLSMLFAATGVFLRDFQFLWGHLTFLLFFLSPILYPLDRISPNLRQYMALNPALPFLRLFQEPVASGQLPSAATVIWAAALAVSAVVAGYAAFMRLERRFYLYL
ncbi:MAG: ABC transporter permease [Bryobacteraceae bacterium]|jgi:ABC-type polysaccharide/polyol phosphate export permease